MTARTLPVTPAERACATVLRAFITWNLDGTREVMTLEYGAMLKLGDFLSAQGLTIEDVGDPTDAGAALLARVEADRSAEDIARELVVKLQTSGAPGLVVSDAQSLLADVRREVARQARLAGTTPIDAPPAKEPT